MRVRVELPAHLCTLARLPSREIAVETAEPVTLHAVLSALEAAYPMLRGTIRDQQTLVRRPFLRFFGCEQDLSHDPPDTPLPGKVARGEEVLLVIGAIAGG
jgi:hypothetical protein